MDIVDSFLVRRAQKKFLLMAIDYFTKWVQAEALAIITAQQVQKFASKLICHFMLPRTIIIGNGRQFIDKRLTEFY